jgi:hypothetical protein
MYLNTHKMCAVSLKQYLAEDSIVSCYPVRKRKVYMSLLHFYLNILEKKKSKK